MHAPYAMRMAPFSRATEKNRADDRPKAPSGAAIFVVCVSMLVPLTTALLYVRSYGVNVFHADEWDFVALLRESARGTLGVSDLLAHHNEHVYLAPWVVMLLLGKLTGYATVPLMYLVVACLLLTMATVYRAYASSIGRTPLALILFAPVPFLLFSFKQYENLLWGNQISFGFAQTFSVLALYFLLADKGGWLGGLAFSGAALSAAVAAGSAAPGLLAWPAGLLLLALRGQRGEATAWARIGAWALLGAAVWGAYLAGYGGPDANATPSFVLEHPLSGAEYLLTLAGASLFWGEGTALAAGPCCSLPPRPPWRSFSSSAGQRRTPFGSPWARSPRCPSRSSPRGALASGTRSSPRPRSPGTRRSPYPGSWHSTASSRTSP